MFRFSENPESAVWNLRAPSLLARVSFSFSVLLLLLLLLLLLILTPDIFDVEILFFNGLQRKNFQILTEFCQNLLEIWWKSWENSEIFAEIRLVRACYPGLDWRFLLDLADFGVCLNIFGIAILKPALFQLIDCWFTIWEVWVSNQPIVSWTG